MTEELQELGLKVGHRRVGRLMGENGIKIIRTQKYKATTDPCPAGYAEHAREGASSKLFMDETRCPVLDPGRGKTKTGYLWAIARDERPFGDTAPPGVVFCYADAQGTYCAEARHCSATS
jgi:transposase InsO family protein